MGADLYLNSIYDKNRKLYEAKFDAAVEKRNKIEDTKGRTYSRTQKLVTLYYNKMNSEGYYRDSYNGSNLLWLFGLSYWDDMPRYLNKENQITPLKAKKLLEDLETLKPIFEKNLSELGAGTHKEFPPKEYTQNKRLGWIKYFLDKYVELKKFLNQSIELGEPINCSI